LPALLDFPTSPTNVCNVYVEPDGEIVCGEAERSDASSRWHDLLVADQVVWFSAENGATGGCSGCKSIVSSKS
jgi:hypothetical protein